MGLTLRGASSPVASDSPTSAVEFKSYLIYMWTTKKPAVFIFGMGILFIDQPMDSIRRWGKQVLLTVLLKSYPFHTLISTRPGS
jgi:hypothetical protein